MQEQSETKAIRVPSYSYFFMHILLKWYAVHVMLVGAPFAVAIVLLEVLTHSGQTEFVAQNAMRIIFAAAILSLLSIVFLGSVIEKRLATSPMIARRVAAQALAMRCIPGVELVHASTRIRPAVRATAEHFNDNDADSVYAYGAALAAPLLVECQLDIKPNYSLMGVFRHLSAVLAVIEAQEPGLSRQRAFEAVAARGCAFLRANTESIETVAGFLDVPGGTTLDAGEIEAIAPRGTAA